MICCIVLNSIYLTSSSITLIVASVSVQNSATLLQVFLY